jgi:membrane fusion protein, multidrug efflux system
MQQQHTTEKQPKVQKNAPNAQSDPVSKAAPPQIIAESTDPDSDKAKKSRTRRIVLPVIILLALAGIGTFYWLKSGNYETTDNAQIDGNILPVRSSVTAYIDTICFTDNQTVKKGDTLIRFNTDALQSKVQQAEASLDNANADVLVNGNKVSASLQNANASLQTSQYGRQDIIAAKANLDKARQDFERANELLKIKAATKEQYETTRAALLVAEADYTRAVGRQQSSASTALGLKATTQSAQHQTSAARALVKQRQAELDLARLELSHAFVIAPCDGLVSKRAVQPGQYVSSGQTLCAVVDTRHLWISANFKETQLSKLKTGQQASIKVDAYPDLTVKGHLESFGGATGAKFSLLPPDNSTGNFIKITQRFPIRIAIDTFFESGNKPTVLYSGLSVFIKVNTR